MNRTKLWPSALPLLFPILWSTGFIGAKLGLPSAEPFTFLGLRLSIAAVLLLLVALLTRAPWPRSWPQVGHIVVAGLLVHAIHLGGVFNAIHFGLPAGIAALIMGLQPLLTATLAGRLLAERVSPRQWWGLALGLLGIVLVLSNRFGSGLLPWSGVASVAVALLAMTLGTLYQKRYCAQMDLRSGVAIQYLACGLVLFPVAALFETLHIRWTGEFVFALAWLVLVLSVGAVGLLLTLIRRGAASRVASLFYLSPPFAALFAYFLFAETLGLLALLGMAVVALGVILVNTSNR